MKSKFTAILLVVLVLLNVGNFIYGYSNTQKTIELRNTLENLPKQPVVYVGKDGYTPKKGIDYKDGTNGVDGINSISFVTTETIVKEVPLIGVKGDAGADGKDGAEQMIQVNQDTKDIESKLSNYKYWSVLVYCSDYRLVCP